MDTYSFSLESKLETNLLKQRPNGKEWGDQREQRDSAKTNVLIIVFFLVHLYRKANSMFSVQLGCTRSSGGKKMEIENDQCVQNSI